MKCISYCKTKAGHTSDPTQILIFLSRNKCINVVKSVTSVNVGQVYVQKDEPCKCNYADKRATKSRGRWRRWRASSPTPRSAPPRARASPPPSAPPTPQVLPPTPQVPPPTPLSVSDSTCRSTVPLLGIWLELDLHIYYMYFFSIFFLFLLISAICFVDVFS